MSPREWIKLLKLENRERLLQLLDLQIKELESDAEEETTMVSYVEMHVDKQLCRKVLVNGQPDLPAYCLRRGLFTKIRRAASQFQIKGLNARGRCLNISGIINTCL